MGGSGGGMYHHDIRDSLSAPEDYGRSDDGGIGGGFGGPSSLGQKLFPDWLFKIGAVYRCLIINPVTFQPILNGNYDGAITNPRQTNPRQINPRHDKP